MAPLGLVRDADEHAGERAAVAREHGASDDGDAGGIEGAGIESGDDGWCGLAEEADTIEEGCAGSTGCARAAGSGGRGAPVSWGWVAIGVGMVGVGRLIVAAASPGEPPAGTLGLQLP